MKKLKTFTALTIIAALSIAVYASVTFDASTGTGFVGKGDVQLAFGWNNAAAQKYGREVTFSYLASTTYQVTCYFETGPNDTPHYVNHKKKSGVNANILYDARTHKQIDGYFLTGLGATEGEEGAVPQVGDPCPGNQGNGAVIYSIDGSSSEGDGGLYVNWGGNSVLIWSPAP